MKVLVAYATRHGSTEGIAERIAETLSARGHESRAIPVEQVEDLAGYDAAVIGGAAYMYRWLKPALHFVEHHRQELQQMPVWLFSSGPLGEKSHQEQLEELESARPKEFDELVAMVRPRGEKVFFGAYDPQADPIGLVERITRAMPAAKEALPTGDFRDWDEIEAWAGWVADELESGTAS